MGSDASVLLFCLRETEARRSYTIDTLTYGGDDFRSILKRVVYLDTHMLFVSLCMYTICLDLLAAIFLGC